MNDKQIFIFGNGGAAANASHFAADLGKGTLGRRYEGEKRVRVTSLTDNVTTLTAYANDLSFEDIFVQQLRNLLNPGDLVIAITGSGNSPNVLKAIEYAKKKGALTIGVLGFKTGGKAARLADHAIIIQSDHYGIIEDTCTVLHHLITDCLTKLKAEYDGNEESRLS